MITDNAEIEFHVHVSLDGLEVTEVEHDDGLYDRMVEEGKLLPDNVLQRFAIPPEDHPSMLWGQPEYFRFYNPDGARRAIPRDFSELVELFVNRDQVSLEEAERHVALNSRAKEGDKDIWHQINLLGYADYLPEFEGDEGLF